jgi:predicted metalloendopeptidase
MSRMNVSWLALAALALVPTAVGAQGKVKPLETSNMDTTCAPCRNFFRYANGGWLARTEIPGDRPGWGSFYELQDQNFTALHQVLDDAARDAKTTSSPNFRKLGLFYASCMDTTAIESAGIGPLRPELERIAGIRDARSVQAELTRLQARQVNAGFVYGSTPDAKRSERTIAQIYQGGLGLPDRDYYTKPDSASKALRAQYVDHVGRMLRLAGDDSAGAARSAAAIMSLETALAGASMTQEEQRDPEAIYHLTSAADLERTTRTFDWAEYFHERQGRTPGQVNVAQPAFVRAFDSLLVAVSPADWRSYLKWQLVAASAPALGSAFVNESFRFNGKILQGLKEQRPRWRRCLNATDNSLGEILGQAFVAKHFTPGTKARARQMVKNIQAEFRARLDKLTWMSDATKAKAYVKLDAMFDKIGYPDKWRDYSKLEISSGPYVTNLERAALFESRRDLDKVDKPTNRNEWGMTPPTVNASYNPSYNALTFPAGIMQPPFFDPDADDAVNYGGMGAVIGHEITHGFDDQGRQYDAKGNLSGWWDTTDARNFTERAQRLVKQASAYVVVDSLRMNGKLTLGENIADLGGVLIAYGAYRRSLAGKPEPPPIDGLTGDQRFFLGWAQIWRSKDRPEFSRLLVTVDPHGPSAFRVNGPLSNIPAFARAFGCQPSDSMVRPDSVKVRIW